MSIPREVKLKAFSEGLRMIQAPVAELQSIRGASQTWKNKIISPRNGNLLKGLSGDAYEINAEFQVNTGAAAEFGFKVRTGENEYTKIGYSKTALHCSSTGANQETSPLIRTLTLESMRPRWNRSLGR